MPLVGISRRADAMLIAACRPNWIKRPVAASSTHLSCSCHSKDEIGVRVGQHVLYRAFARSLAPHPAADKSLQGALDLIGIAGIGVEKAVNPVGHVRKPLIGGEHHRGAADKADAE